VIEIQTEIQMEIHMGSEWTTQGKDAQKVKINYNNYMIYNTRSKLSAIS